jgi:tripartite-type tricarboxylate transporter receptor subunit TctC
MRLKHGLLLALLAPLTLPAAAFAQGSQKPIQLIVPFAPGGSADGIARIIAADLGTRLNRQVVVENKPGAGGTIGLMLAAKSPADGDTLTLGATGAMVINPHVQSDHNFDPLRELAPVAKLIDIPIVMATNAKTGAKNVKELIERAKAAPGGLNYGTTGVNSSQHLAVELLAKMTGGKFVHVPYRGSNPAGMAVIGDQVPLVSSDLTAAHPQIKGGLLTAIGVTSARRAKTAPEIPTIAEGGVPGYDGSAGFMGLFAPAGTPAARIKQLTAEVAQILAKPDVQEKVALLSVEPAYLDDASFGAMLARESAKWKDVLKARATQ